MTKVFHLTPNLRLCHQLFTTQSEALAVTYSRPTAYIISPSLYKCRLSSECVFVGMRGKVGWRGYSARAEFFGPVRPREQMLSPKHYVYILLKISNEVEG